MPTSASRSLSSFGLAIVLALTLAAPVAADEPHTHVGSVHLDATAAYDPQTKEVTLTGTATCQQAGILSVFADATQQIGQHTVLGNGFADAICTESLDAVPVSLTLVSGAGFNPGTVEVSVFVFSCDASGCTDSGYSLTVDAWPTNNAPTPVEPPPANDDVSGAWLVDHGTFTQSTATATGSETDPTCPGVEFIDHTVWYAFTAGTDGWLHLSTQGSSYDTVVVVLDAAGALVGCNDDISSGAIVASDVTVPVTTGGTYLIVVGSWQWTPGGDLVLTLAEGTEPEEPEPTVPPANDEPGGAYPLTVGGSASQPLAEIAAATSSVSDPLDAPCEFPVGFNGNTVWYTVTPGYVGYLDVNTFGSTYDTTLYAFDAAGDLIVCNDQTGGNQSQVILPVTAGTTYLFMVGAWHGTPPGDLVISAAESPAPLEVEVEIDAVGSLSRGEVTLTGTVTCTVPADAEVVVSVFQGGGRFPAEGSGVAVSECGPTPTAWTVMVAGTSRYQTGDAFATVEAFAATTDGRSGAALTETELRLVQAAGARR